MSEQRDSMLAKAVHLLQAFRPHGQTLTLTLLVAKTGLSKATVHRLAEELVELGLLERRPIGYRPGIGLFELGELVHTKSNMRTVALPFMEDLYETTRATVHLAVPDGKEVVYAEKLQGHNSIEIPTRVGGRLPMTCTAGGKALLAHADAATLKSVLSHPLRRLTNQSVTDPNVLHEQLSQIRATGLAKDHEGTTLGASCLAVPIFVEGIARGALSVSMPSDQLVEPNLAPALRAVGFAFARAMYEAKLRYLEGPYGQLIAGGGRSRVVRPTALPPTGEQDD
ncbi:IclR family transcriptional regulator [Nocardia sp. NPDC004123]